MWPLYVLSRTISFLSNQLTYTSFGLGTFWNQDLSSSYLAYLHFPAMEVCDVYFFSLENTFMHNSPSDERFLSNKSLYSNNNPSLKFRHLSQRMSFLFFNTRYTRIQLKPSSQGYRSLQLQALTYTQNSLSLQSLSLLLSSSPSISLPDKSPSRWACSTRAVWQNTYWSGICILNALCERIFRTVSWTSTVFVSASLLVLIFMVINVPET